MRLYKQAEIIPSTDTIKKVEQTMGIYLNDKLNSFESKTPVIKALSQNGQPLVVKFFIDEEMANFEANIGLQLKESDCNGKTLI